MRETQIVGAAWAGCSAPFVWSSWRAGGRPTTRLLHMCLCTRGFKSYFPLAATVRCVCLCESFKQVLLHTSQCGLCSERPVSFFGYQSVSVSVCGRACASRLHVYSQHKSIIHLQWVVFFWFGWHPGILWSQVKFAQLHIRPLPLSVCSLIADGGQRLLWCFRDLKVCWLRACCCFP